MHLCEPKFWKFKKNPLNIEKKNCILKCSLCISVEHLYRLKITTA